MFDFNRLLQKFQQDYYLSPILFIVELAAIVIAFRYRQQELLWKVFVFYMVSDFLILSSDIFLTAYTGISKSIRSRYIDYTNSLISLIELVCYYIFFTFIFTENRIKRTIRHLGIFFALLVLVYFIGSVSFFSSQLNYFSYLLDSIEFILIIPFCMLYYNKVLNTSSGENILSRPSFWIITGIFFYSVFSIPSYLIFNYIRKSHPYILNEFITITYFTPFTLNFIFLARAFSLNLRLSK